MTGISPVASAVLILDTAILCYFLMVNGFYAVLLYNAVWEIRNHLLTDRAENRWRLLRSTAAPVVSLLVPAHNEASTIHDSVRGMLGIYYPRLEVVVINDGSSDTTMAVLAEKFALVPVIPVFRKLLSTAPVNGLYRSRTHPNLVVVDKQNGGKADSLNAGINVASGKLVCAVDADTLIEPEAVQRMVWLFLTTAGVVAVGGTIRVANGSRVRGGRVVATRAPRQSLGGIQVVEYLRAFLFGRLGWNRLGGTPIISGAFGLFDLAAVREAGGYVTDTVGEDLELVFRLRRKGYEKGRPAKVVFAPDPVAWTEAPSSLRVLSHQRERWHRGLAETLWRHRRLMLNRRYGSLGMLAYPYFLFVELLSPIVEVVGLVGLAVGLSLGAVDFTFALVYFLVAYGLGIVLAAAAVALEEFSFHRYGAVSDRFVLLGWGVLENLGFRQLTVLFRINGLVKFVRKKSDWGRMQRQGFSS